MENVLCEAGLAKLDENRKLNSTKLAIRILTNTDHPIRPYFTNPNKLDEYAMRTRNPQPLYIKIAKYLGETQIDISRIEMSPRYNRPPWKPLNEKQFDVRLSAFGPGNSSERYRTKTAGTLDEDCGNHVKIYTDGSKLGDKVGYDIVKEAHTIKKRILPQKTVFSAEQSAIIGAIQSETNSRNEIVIITDSLRTIMAAESRTPTKNPKSQTIRKMMDQEGPRITLLWVTSHKGIPGNKKADQAAKEALDKDIPTTERYPPDDLMK
jgi:ribonuclease HI